MARPKTPEITVDTIIGSAGEDSSRIVLIGRRFDPPGWALPGGFVDVGETLERAAVREALEETSLHVSLTALLGCYSNPTRDPRGHTISAVYIATGAGELQAEDDAANAGWFSIDDLPAPLAFDHELIIADYRHYLATGAVAPIRM